VVVAELQKVEKIIKRGIQVFKRKKKKALRRYLALGDMERKLREAAKDVEHRLWTLRINAMSRTEQTAELDRLKVDLEHARREEKERQQKMVENWDQANREVNYVN
jgi:hypothetical protein